VADCALALARGFEAIVLRGGKRIPLLFLMNDSIYKEDCGVTSAGSEFVAAAFLP
jgi:hypothetical protein